MEETTAISNPPQVALIAAVLKLQNQHKSGASWFYWIAGLSIFNSILGLAGSSRNFLVGLGLPYLAKHLFTNIEPPDSAEWATGLNVALFLVSLFAAGVFAFLGTLAMKRRLWAYTAGMILYVIDGLMFLVGMDVLSIGFHALALICIYRGLQASIRLRALELALGAVRGG